MATEGASAISTLLQRAEGLGAEAEQEGLGSSE